jgi:hypothetical protein
MMWIFGTMCYFFAGLLAIKICHTFLGWFKVIDIHQERPTKRGTAILTFIWLFWPYTIALLATSTFILRVSSKIGQGLSYLILHSFKD